METNQFSPHDAVETINTSLNEAKMVKTGARFYYLLWGTILFLYYTINAYLKHSEEETPNPFLFILGIFLFPLGGLISGLRKRFDKKNENATSKLEQIYFIGFIGFALAYAILFVSSLSYDPTITVIYFPLLIGLTVFNIGYNTKHWPSVIGGVISMLCSLFNWNYNYDVVYSISAFAALVALIIPGLLMKNRNV